MSNVGACEVYNQLHKYSNQKCIAIGVGAAVVRESSAIKRMRTPTFEDLWTANMGKFKYDKADM